MSFEWETSPEQAFIPMTDQYIRDIRAEISAVLLRFEPEIEAWLKANAPWVDRTGNLRASLWADAVQFGQDLFLLFDYGLDYGVFLELGNSGAYAVIAPALDVFAPRIWAEIERLFK